ncbi:MAG: RNA pseudouridine synthase [Pirellulales bacterium]|nr:RNA pseudouridine synthase [Pirellulales bacterium]HJN67572.1 RNA pseudouridine synthase [Pirellulales bacterium]
MSAAVVDLVYEQGPCLVVNKPSGLLTQAPPGIDSLERRVKEFLKAREQKTGNIYLGVPHRLDRPVSGALILARHVRACRRISEQFSGRTLRKVYWALVQGRVRPEAGEWCDWMRKIPGQARGEIVPSEVEGAREARLTYRTLGETPFGSWLEVELKTGRMHQIRLQSASRGHPVLGDVFYGAEATLGKPEPDPRRNAIALHGRRVCFRHPMTREQVAVTAPLPGHWNDLVLETHIAALEEA